jgi:creatinine amidohydrolase
MLDAATATWVEVQQRLSRPTVAVIAIGALEQHGPHLPLATDTVMSAGVARRLAGDLDALLLPPIAYGDAWNNGGFLGTLSLAPATVRAIVVDIGRGLHASGVRGLIVVNGHFGNREPIAQAARALYDGVAFPVLLLDYPELERLAQQICTSAPAAPSFYHADELETSIMLALMPEAVHMDRAAAEYPVFPPTYGAEPIMLHTFCRSGVFGDPTHATAAKGERLLDGLADASRRVAAAFLARLGLSE